MFDIETKTDILLRLQEVYTEIEKYLGFKPKCYFAGGCIASIVLGEDVQDYDLWFETPEDFAPVEKANIMFTDDTKYALTTILPSGKKVQFIRRRRGPPDVLVKTFDFQHTQSYYNPENGDMVVDSDFIRTKQLVLKGNLDHPLNTMERLMKFQRRGYTVSSEALSGLMLAIKGCSEEKLSEKNTHGGSL